MLVSTNPATGEKITEYSPTSDQEVITKINNANQEFFNWRITDFTTRAKLLKNLQEQLSAHKQSLAKTVHLEMGKSINEAEAEITKCAKLCEYYANNGEEFLKDEIIKTDFKKSYHTYQPLGVILGIMPWNFPIWQVMRFAVPTILAGNTVVLKHASNVSGCSLAIEQLFLKAGFAQNIFTSLLIPSNKIEPIIKNNLVKAVSLTGSTQAGKSVAQIAGKNLKKCVLELGGSDPYIILEDADLKLAAEKCTQTRLLNSGQSCIAGKRFIVVKQVYNEFIEKLANQFKNYPKLAPLALENAPKDLQTQVEQTINQGAKCIMGGSLPKDNGYFYPKTILTDVTEDMPAFREELFGPVACVIKANNLEDAIQLANNTQFGLGGGIFSKNIQLAEKIAKYNINAGACFINDFVKSNPYLAFGGINNSGFGRELSHLGLKEFVNVKTVCVGE